jgi:hypothetical protein
MKHQVAFDPDEHLLIHLVFRGDDHPAGIRGMVFNG